MTKMNDLQKAYDHLNLRYWTTLLLNFDVFMVALLLTTMMKIDSKVFAYDLILVSLCKLTQTHLKNFRCKHLTCAHVQPLQKKTLPKTINTLPFSFLLL